CTHTPPLTPTPLPPGARGEGWADLLGVPRTGGRPYNAHGGGRPPHDIRWLGRTPRDRRMSTATTPPHGPVNGSPAADVRRVTVPDFQSARSRGVRLTMLTAYDYTMARLLDA